MQNSSLEGQLLKKMQVMREISVLKEARIGLLADFYNAWIGFINARGDIKR